MGMERALSQLPNHWRWTVGGGMHCSKPCTTHRRQNVTCINVVCAALIYTLQNHPRFVIWWWECLASSIHEDIHIYYSSSFWWMLFISMKTSVSIFALDYQETNKKRGNFLQFDLIGSRLLDYARSWQINNKIFRKT